jgi:hypothetical protein
MKWDAGRMCADGQPDWVIDVDAPPARPTEEQKALLAELERVLASFGQRAVEPRGVIAVVAPLVRELHDSGMAADRIAAHSRIRPEGISRILSGDLSDPE